MENSNEKCLNLIVLYFIIAPIEILLELLIGIKVYIIYALFIIFLFVYNKKYIKSINYKRNLLLLLFFLLYSARSLFIYKDFLYNWLGMCFLLFIYSLPWFYISNSIEDWKSFFEKCENKLNMIFLSNVILFIGSLILHRRMLGNMEISYSILPLMLMSLYMLFKGKNKIRSIIYFVFSLILVVIVGSRGPLLCLLSFITLILIINVKKTIKYFIPIILGFVIVIVNFQTILNISIKILEENNLSSRTLYKLKEHTIMTDTGRNKIQNVVKEQINSNWLVGSGIGGERIKVNEKIYNMQKDMNSCYPHNIILEVYSNYGIIIGTFIILIISIRIIYFNKNRSMEGKNVLAFFFSCEVIRLLVSSSYLRSPIFFIFLGILFYKKEKRYNYDSNSITN